MIQVATALITPMANAVATAQVALNRSSTTGPLAIREVGESPIITGRSPKSQLTQRAGLDVQERQVSSPPAFRASAPTILVSLDMSADPIVYKVRWNVRPYELDGNGHVNNAVYLNYAEALTIEHAEAAGYGAAWTEAHSGAWMVHRSIVTHHLPAVYGDALDLTVRVELVLGVRGIRRTTIQRHADGAAIAEVLTEWVWVGRDGRPARVPRELVELARDATSATLRRNPTFVRDIGRRV